MLLTPQGCLSGKKPGLNLLRDVPVALQRVNSDWLQQAAVELAVLRLDQLDPVLSGNKPFKLAGYLQLALSQGACGLLSVGGAHSNHLHALAALAKQQGLPCVGLLRGEPQQTPTVMDLQAWGMTLHWLSHGDYRQRHHESFWRAWQARYPGYLLIGEGGSGAPGLSGCAMIVEHLRAGLAGIGWSDYDALWLAVGSGTTLAGLVLAEQGAHPLWGALAVPPRYQPQRQIEALLAEAGCPAGGYQLVDASLGGFARVNAELLQSMGDFTRHSGIPLEPIYTGKALLALRQYVQRGYFPPGTRLVMLHSGGLQGVRALQADDRQGCNPQEARDE